MNPLKARLAGLAATVAILAFVAGIPAILLALGAPDLAPLAGDVWQRLTAPDDGTLVLVVLGAAAWVAWAVLTLSLLVEVAARLRGIRAPTLPGLRVPQQAATRLVAAAALLFTPVPVAAAAFSAPAAHAAPARPLEPDHGGIAGVDVGVDAGADDVLTTPTTPPRPTPATGTPEPAPTTEPSSGAASTVPYTVRRGDSLWSIARERLGDGTRYTELVALNHDLLGGRPDFILPGTVLRIPAPDTPTTPAGDGTTTHVVQPGDTLSEVAATRLGDADRYPEIAAASADTVQPDGDRLTDPDLIRPGWILTIPTTPPARPVSAPTTPAPVPAPEITPQPVETPTAAPEPDPGPAPQAVRPPGPAGEPAAKATPTTAPETGDVPPATEKADQPVEDAAVPGWLLPGLTGAGALLAGALALRLHAHRRTQLRFRRPGTVLAPTPTALHPVERTTHVTGEPAAPQLQALDRLLRGLALDCPAGTPALELVELAADHVVLHLAHDTDLPAPWTGHGTRWTARLEDAADAGDTEAPYPLLAAIGADHRGHTVLVNLDHRTTRLTGDHDRALALARALAADLVLNPWAEHVTVHALQVAGELAGIDHLRFHHHGEPATATGLAADLTGASGGHRESVPAVVTTARHADRPEVRPVSDVGAVVVVGGDPAAGELVIHAHADGRLTIPAVGPGLTAAGLTAEEAAACAAIVQVTRDSTRTVPAPVDDPLSGWQAAADGTRPAPSPRTRSRPETGPAGDESLLPRATDDYTAVAATTADDVHGLAPVTADHENTAHGDPTLDDDVAAWFDDDAPVPVPKVTVLGPVSAIAHGDASAVAKRRAYYTELLAYLALHPRGVTSQQLADAFALSPVRVRVDAGALRAWLGTDPRTGEKHLPPADAADAAAHTGVPTYQLQGVLLDADLFDRLRTRAKARGKDGITDLQTALRLVTGEPFDQLRPGGWAWLLQGARLDHTLAAAIVDVAHLVGVRALADGDLTLARFAAETGLLAAPYDDVVRLDLIAVTAAEGHDELAHQQLVEDVFNRSDDDLGPIDLPPRTARIVADQPWSPADHGPPQDA